MIIRDTGFWLALGNAKDRHHRRAADAFQALDEALITTWPVLTETCHLLANRVGTAALERFVSAGAGGAFEVFSLEQTHLSRVAVLVESIATCAWIWQTLRWSFSPKSSAPAAFIHRRSRLSNLSVERAQTVYQPAER